MSLHEFDYTKIYTADTVAKSSECIYSRDTYHTTGDFAVVMNAGSYAEWKIESCKSGKFTITVKYSSDIDSEIAAALGINSEEKVTLKFVPCRYYARTKNEYRTGVMRCARAVVELEKGENTIFIKLPEYDKYGTVRIDTISVSDGRLCEMRQPIYDISDFTTDNDGTTDCAPKLSNVRWTAVRTAAEHSIFTMVTILSAEQSFIRIQQFMLMKRREYTEMMIRMLILFTTSPIHISRNTAMDSKRCFIRKAVKTLQSRAAEP